jgi:predicted nucleic acid-binding Zn ribbon protein
VTGADARPGKGRPERLGDVLRGFLAQTGMDERLAEAAIVPEWEERVGAAIAAVTTPLRVSGGTLIVAVRSSAWLMELQMMERRIRDTLNEGRTRGRIRKVRFVMGADGAPENSAGRRT